MGVAADGMKENTESLFVAVREGCSASLWSRAVELTRTASFVLERTSAEEWNVRVVEKRPISPRVTLWPQDDNWACDCGGADDPCVHAAAAVIALRSGNFSETDVVRVADPTAFVVYSFERNDGRLYFYRYIQEGQERKRLSGSLIGYVGGVQSGRLRGGPVASSKRDFAVDTIAQDLPQGRLDKESVQLILKALVGLPHVELDGRPILPSTELVRLMAKVEREGRGMRLRRLFDRPVDELFKNGLARCGDQLLQVVFPPLTAYESELLTVEGAFFAPWDIERLVSEIIPALNAKLPVEFVGADLPQLSEAPPRIVLETSTEESGGVLIVKPRLVYGDPAFAEVLEGRLELRGEQVPTRDRGAEQALARSLQYSLNLQPGRAVRFVGEEGIKFAQGLEGWSVVGDGVSNFRVVDSLHAVVELRDEQLDIGFQGTGAAGSVGVDFVLSSWERGERYVKLEGGGWAKVPEEWLERYGAAAKELIAARDRNKQLPRSLLPALGELCDALGVESPLAVQGLRELLARAPVEADAVLPSDLTVTLRKYQRVGVAWLQYMSSIGFGAMLADDMGLGKTLQALCALSGRSLVVAPTSVIYSWIEQAQRFRPGLSISLYHGAGRTLDEQADVIVTSYGVLRLDQDLLAASEWGTVVVDEAQQIKNPDSQVARAVHRLRGQQRIALSGTPIENSLEDLWSQFQFINPGLCGTRQSFQQRFVKAAGEVGVQQQLRARVRPFILRRLKREVAPELPPRTEVTLHCELSDAEREVYRTVLTATRAEVSKKLDEGAGMFSILESLLRIRQVCCLPALVPGVELRESAKLNLLIESVQEGWGLGHRALIFSQWTSLLDVVEERLREVAIGFIRLDGTTRDRQQVVQTFQKEDGPPVFLLSLKAGGTGLTLTAADHVYLIDPWWNPAVEDQAADRAHRIGQENPVLIRRLIARDTIEERIQELQQKKLGIARAITEGDTGGDLKITRDDLLALLS